MSTPPAVDDGAACPETLFEVAAAGLPNLRNRTVQDRFACGMSGSYAWVAVADGISGGPDGDIAADLAIHTVQAIVGQSDTVDLDLLVETTVRANATVRTHFARAGGVGGTTLTIAATDHDQVFVVALGDSPAYLSRPEGWSRLTPHHDGPLESFVGAADTVTPWRISWRVQPVHVVNVLVCSDGVEPGRAPETTASPAADVVHAILSTFRNEDDATAAALRRRPVGEARPELSLSVADIPAVAEPPTVEVLSTIDMTESNSGAQPWS